MMSAAMGCRLLVLTVMRHSDSGKRAHTHRAHTGYALIGLVRLFALQQGCAKHHHERNQHI